MRSESIHSHPIPVSTFDRSLIPTEQRLSVATGQVNAQLKILTCGVSSRHQGGINAWALSSVKREISGGPTPGQFSPVVGKNSLARSDFSARKSRVLRQFPPFPIFPLSFFIPLSLSPFLYFLFFFSYSCFLAFILFLPFLILTIATTLLFSPNILYSPFPLSSFSPFLLFPPSGIGRARIFIKQLRLAMALRGIASV